MGDLQEGEFYQIMPPLRPNQLQSLIPLEGYANCLFFFPENYADFKTTNAENDVYGLRGFNRYGEHKMRPRACGIVFAMGHQPASRDMIDETIIMFKYRYIALVGGSAVPDDATPDVRACIKSKISEMRNCHIKI